LWRKRWYKPKAFPFLLEIRSHPAPWALHYLYCIPAVNAMSTPAATIAVIFTLMLQAMISTNTGEFQTSSWNNSFT
jgi:hypothetical protein